MASDLRIEGVPCFEHAVIQDESLPALPKAFPFSKDFLDGLVASFPVVVEFPSDDEEAPERAGPYNRVARLDGTNLGLRRISTEHGRSYEIFMGSPDQVPQAIWEDEYGNQFTSLSIKGGNFTDPHIMTSQTAPSGYIPYGLLETDAFKRVVRASRLLREKSVATEMIVRVFEPQYLRYKKLDPETGATKEDEFEYVPQPEFKRRLLQDHWKKIADREDANDEFEKVSGAINAMSYFFTLRAMDTSTRLKDLLVNTETVFRGEIDKVFKALNARHVLSEEGKSKKLKPYSAESNEQVIDYLTRLLPQWIGTNLGGMHRLGLTHTFPHMGNVTTSGELVDLDSVRGEPLGMGDAAVTEEDFQTDIDYIVGDIHDSANDVVALFVTASKLCDGEDKDLGYKNQRLFRANFIQSYVGTRYEWPDSREINEFTEAKFLMELPNVDRLLSNILDMNSVILEDLLKSAFDSTEYPVLMAGSEIEEAGAAYAEWIQSPLSNHLMERALKFINDTPLADMHSTTGTWFYENEANKFIATVGAEYRRENLIAPHVVAKEFKQQVRTWVLEHKKPECNWSTEGLSALLETSLTYKAGMEINSQLIKRGVGSASNFNLTARTVLNDWYDAYDAQHEPLKLIADGQIFLVRDRISLEEVYENVAKEIYGSAVRIIHEGGTTQQGLSVRVPKDFVLMEILTNQVVPKVNVQLHGDNYEGDATISIASDGSQKYFAYSLLNELTGQVTLYVIE